MNHLYRYLLLLILPAAVHATDYNQVQSSTLSFAYKQMGVPMEGKFSKSVLLIHFDPSSSSTAKAQFDVDLASIDTGSAEANEEVIGKQWFNTKVFPSARFISTGVKALGGNRYEALGKLTIKGKTREVTAPFSFKQEARTGIFDGAFVLNRLDYAIGEGPWADVSAVANEIQIKFHIVANAAIK
jgi:polyisoprenoid-binding protein YceI